MGGENSKHIEADIPVYQQLTFLPKESASFSQKNPPLRHHVGKSAILPQHSKLTTFHNIKIQQFFA
jgi:hypothetical protein